MTINELANELKLMYDNAKSDRVAMIHVFGIKFANEIKENKYRPVDILKLANMPESYYAEINKGVKLSSYVNLKDKYL